MNRGRAAHAGILTKIASDDLRAKLSKARDEFLTGIDGGREGIISQLGIAKVMLEVAIGANSKSLLSPLGGLLFALTDLSRGNVQPFLIPNRRGKPSTSAIRGVMQGYCAGAFFVLTSRYGLSPTAAVGRIERKVKNYPLSQTRGAPLTARTVRSWQTASKKAVLAPRGRAYLFMINADFEVEDAAPVDAVLDTLEHVMRNNRFHDAV